MSGKGCWILFLLWKSEVSESDTFFNKIIARADVMRYNKRKTFGGVEDERKRCFENHRNNR